jgi:cyclic beta-1,2-glucan synthetase
VSTVDSGNLAGHLIALANACREWKVRPLDARQRLDGVVDALEITRAESVRLRDGGQTQTVTLSQLDDAIAAVALGMRQARLSNDDLTARLVGLQAEAEIMVDIAGALAIERGDGSGADMLFWAQATLKAIVAHRHDLAQSANTARSAAVRLSALEETARSMALAMDFGFLFNRRRQLLSIGFLAPEGALDTNCYDLLASEARLASFFAIAKGDVAAKHWFRLGRAATPVAHGAALISWSGSMFE